MRCLFLLLAYCNIMLGLCKMRCFPAVALAWDRISGLHIYPNLNSETIIVDSAPALWHSAQGSDKTNILLLVHHRFHCYVLYHLSSVTDWLYPFVELLQYITTHLSSLSSIYVFYRLILIAHTKLASLFPSLLLRADFCFYTILRWWLKLHCSIQVLQCVNDQENHAHLTLKLTFPTIKITLIIWALALAPRSGVGDQFVFCSSRKIKVQASKYPKMGISGHAILWAGAQKWSVLVGRT